MEVVVIPTIMACQTFFYVSMLGFLAVPLIVTDSHSKVQPAASNVSEST